MLLHVRDGQDNVHPLATNPAIRQHARPVPLPAALLPGSFDLVGRRTKRIERRRNVQRHLDAVARASLDGEHAVDAAPDAVPDAVAWVQAELRRVAGTVMSKCNS